VRVALKSVATSAKAAETVTRYNNVYTQKSTSSSVYDKGYAQRLETGNYTNSSAVYDASEKVYAIKIPASTTIYEDPVGYQGGMYLGGMETKQVFIQEPWKNPGVTIMKYPK